MKNPDFLLNTNSVTVLIGHASLLVPYLENVLTAFTCIILFMKIEMEGTLSVSRKAVSKI